jgi:hypothetical protein
MIKVKEDVKHDNDIDSKVVFQYESVKIGIPNAPESLPVGIPSVYGITYVPIKVPKLPEVKMPEASLPRSINYYADYGGCGFWRMIWPEYCMNAYSKSVITGLTSMVLDLRFYNNIKAIRFQRQATPTQKRFVEELYKNKKDFEYRLLYEVDDIVFKDDIPDYNRCKDAFCDSSIEESIKQIIEMMDEMTVTCKYMKDYYISKTGNKNITILPNYAPKFWLNGYYNKERIQKLYEKNKKQPRILYAGSGTHIDVTNRTGMQDDFYHVVKEIIKARKKFKFVWKGCYPLEIKPFIANGEMEYIEWSPLLDLPKNIWRTECNATFASLADNVFNKSKSNIKMIESGAFGMPGVYQDLCTYEDAEFKFKSGQDLIFQLEHITSDFNRYMKASENARNFTEGLWLEDHLDEYEALYTTAWGSKERNEISQNLIRLNPEQKF